MPARFKVAVIGVGNMGSALVRGLVGRAGLAGRDVIAADADRARLQALAREVGIEAAASNRQAAEQSEAVVLAVKPGVLRSVAEEISPVLTPDQTVISIAAGVSCGRLQQWLGAARPALVRVMPNTPALVGAGAIAVAPGPGLDAERLEGVARLLGALGDVVVVEEPLMDAVTGLSGSGPAFVFLMMEALADGGVAAGLPRPIAARLAAQTVLGAARLAMETGQHPGALKDMVASPAGTTVAGLAELERAGFRGAVISAVMAAARRARELSGE